MNGADEQAGTAGPGQGRPPVCRATRACLYVKTRRAMPSSDPRRDRAPAPTWTSPRPPAVRRADREGRRAIAWRRRQAQAGDDAVACVRVGWGDCQAVGVVAAAW